MEKIKFLVMMTCMFSGALHANHLECNAPEFGPPGPRGPEGFRGPRGPRGPIGIPGYFQSVYASSYAIGSQTTFPTPYAILFTTEQVPPIGITHPVAANFSQFQVQNSGLYRIGWTFTVQGDDDEDVSVRLFNVTTNTPIVPSAFSVQTPTQGLLVEDNNSTVSGQTIIPLTAGTVIRLEIVLPGVLESVDILNPSFIMTQITPL